MTQSTEGPCSRTGLWSIHYRDIASSLWQVFKTGSQSIGFRISYNGEWQYIFFFLNQLHANSRAWKISSNLVARFSQKCSPGTLLFQVHQVTCPMEMMHQLWIRIFLLQVGWEMFLIPALISSHGRLPFLLLTRVSSSCAMPCNEWILCSDAYQMFHNRATEQHYLK